MDIGKRLVPVTLDAIAQSEPDRVWASMPYDGLNTFSDIPVKTFANAVNRTAWWIVDVVGRPEADSFPTITYLGPSDLRYYVMLIAIVKAGYKPLFISHLNSPAANMSLIDQTDCRIILNAYLDVEPIEAGARPQVKTFRVPASDALWNPEPVDLFPFEKSFNDAFNDPFVILHTSGSSGMPKPVIYTHGVMASMDLLQIEESPPGTQTELQRRAGIERIILGFPPYHAAGLTVGIRETIWCKRIIVFPPTDKPLDGQIFKGILIPSGAGGAFLLPRVLEQIGRMPDALAAMKIHLDHLVWVGGPISSEAGDAISKVTTLIQNYASTEIGALNSLCEKLPEDWNYNWFAPGSNGFDFRCVPSGEGEKRLYELFIKRDKKQAQQVFRIFPHLDEWPSNDLFSKHPVRPNLWLHEGRSDDLIVTVNGNKINPRPIETALRTHPQIRDALILGTRRPRVCVIIEPAEAIPSAKHAAFIDGIMPAVSEFNVRASISGQLDRELILVADAATPFPRTGKGTVQRGAAAKLFAGRVDSLYAALPAHLQDVRFERVQGTSA